MRIIERARKRFYDRPADIINKTATARLKDGILLKPETSKVYFPDIIEDKIKLCLSLLMGLNPDTGQQEFLEKYGGALKVSLAGYNIGTQSFVPINAVSPNALMVSFPPMYQVYTNKVVCDGNIQSVPSLGGGILEYFLQNTSGANTMKIGFESGSDANFFILQPYQIIRLLSMADTVYVKGTIGDIAAAWGTRNS